MVKSRINSGLKNKKEKNKNKKKTLKKVRPNMSLYADYHPDSSVKGFGYKNKEIALKTIRKLEKMDKNGELEKKLIGKSKRKGKRIDAEQINNKIRSYKLQVINTMYNRAKFHKFRSNDMLGAMKVFNEYLDKLKRVKDIGKKEKKIKSIKSSKKVQVRIKNKNKK